MPPVAEIGVVVHWLYATTERACPFLPYLSVTPDYREDWPLHHCHTRRDLAQIGILYTQPLDFRQQRQHILTCRDYKVCVCRRAFNAVAGRLTRMEAFGAMRWPDAPYLLPAIT